MSKNLLFSFFGSLLLLFCTTLGSAFVFFFNNKKKSIFSSLFISCSAGIMLSVSIWSLIKPSLEYYQNNTTNVLITCTSLLIGTFLLLLIDVLLPVKENEEISLKSAKLLFLSITIHNVPEGMAVGLSIASAIYLDPQTSIFVALGLAFGVAIQNIPEGSAISVSYHFLGFNKKYSFFKGFLSGIVEPIAAFIAVLFFPFFIRILPWLLSIAAGAMIYVTIKEILPECYEKGNKLSTSIGFCLGFTFMTLLDTLL